MTNNTVKFTTADGIARVVLNRPERKNAINGDVLKSLAEALNSAKNDESTKVVMLSGEGGNFSSGMDLNASFGENSRQDFNECMEALINFDKPLIAVVEGIAIGGGATLSFHADMIYVSDNLRMRLPFVSLGVVPEFASSYLLQTNIGQRRAAEIMYTAEWIDAAKAYELGIATAIFPAAEVHARALEKARQIAKWPVNALRRTNQCNRAPHIEAMKAANQLELKLMGQQMGSPENIEAFTAFVEKREPRF